MCLYGAVDAKYSQKWKRKRNGMNGIIVAPLIASRCRKSFSKLLHPNVGKKEMYNSSSVDLKTKHFYSFLHCFFFQAQINLSTRTKFFLLFASSVCCCFCFLSTNDVFPQFVWFLVQNAFNELLFEEEFFPLFSPLPILPLLINDYLQA